MRKTIPLIVMLLIASIFGCGRQGDIIGSLENLPSARVYGWTKVDLNPDEDLIQPFILMPDIAHEYVEPSLILYGTTFRCYFEIMHRTPEGEQRVHTASEIYLAESDNGFDWTIVNQGRPVFSPEMPWESRYVGAPSVIERNHKFSLYYAGGNGVGIGEAESEDGIIWVRTSADPVLVPDQTWENGFVAAPSALEWHETTNLWYSAGGPEGHNDISAHVGTAIGYAKRVDGAFVKYDASGMSSKDSSADIRPVLVADENWEAVNSAFAAPGRVSSPCVVAFKTTARTVLQMFYTGGEPGELGCGDASIGYAGSTDGVNWEKAEPGVNPIIQEIFALSLYGISEDLNYDEWGPAVLHRENRSFMLFSQIDPLNWFANKERGLAVATNPSMD